MNKRNSGFSAILVLLIIVILIIAASAGSYYLLKSQGRYGTTNDYYAPTTSQTSSTPTPTPTSDATVDIESDINKLEIESPDSDLQKIEKDASSL